MKKPEKLRSLDPGTDREVNHAIVFFVMAGCWIAALVLVYYVRSVFVEIAAVMDDYMFPPGGSSVHSTHVWATYVAFAPVAPILGTVACLILSRRFDAAWTRRGFGLLVVFLSAFCLWAAANSDYMDYGWSRHAWDTLKLKYLLQEWLPTVAHLVAGVLLICLPANPKEREEPPMSLREVDLHDDRPTVDTAIRRVTYHIKNAKPLGVTALKLVHGYGSSGAGGTLRTEIRKYLQGQLNRGAIRDFIIGEKFSIFEEPTRRAFERCPELRKDGSLDRYNNGITIVVLL
ncbi:MAG: Smr/MutS family protein [Oscillospiraceae bacterium]|jgi:hypothetical protein|nr:Smr/MutS family protein [Oscillospiraceae bacterium]